MKKMAYLVLENGNIFIGASFDKKEAIRNAQIMGNCTVVEADAIENDDGSVTLLNVEANDDGTIQFVDNKNETTGVH
jgi:hypothetical protein